MNNYPLSSIEYTQTHTHLTLRLPISTFCKIFLPYFLDGLGVLKHKDCHPACTVQEQLQGFLVSDMQYAMIPSISSPIRSSTTGAAISTAKVSFKVSCEQQMKCMFSSWLLSALGSPANIMAHISNLFHFFYRLSLVSSEYSFKGTITTGRPRAMSFNLWHDIFLPSYKHVHVV